MTIIKKILTGIAKVGTSKWLLFTILGLFVAATVANYTFVAIGLSILPLAATYALIQELMVWEIIVYSGKATIEKTPLVAKAKVLLEKVGVNLSTEEITNEEEEK